MGGGILGKWRRFCTANGQVEIRNKRRRKVGVLVSDSPSDIIFSSNNLKEILCGRACRPDDEQRYIIPIIINR